jgi:hypothetical protein
MAFEPFGYRFSVISAKRPEEAKRALRTGMKGWFETSNGPRGWIIGPVLCLWQSAFDRQGPMVLGLISSDNFGTRVQGRAGSDLNGVMWSAIVFPVLGVLLYKTLSENAVSATGAIVMAIVLLLSPTIFWFAHKDRRHAEPLVNFVRRALDEASPAPQRHHALHPGPYLPMELTVSGDGVAANATPQDIRNAVEAIQLTEGFLALSLSEEVYIQVAFSNGEFVLENREGSDQAHFAARKESGDPFAAEEIIAVLVNYLAGVPDIPGMRWEPICR